MVQNDALGIYLFENSVFALMNARWFLKNLSAIDSVQMDENGKWGMDLGAMAGSMVNRSLSGSYENPEWARLGGALTQMAATRTKSKRVQILQAYNSRNGFRELGGALGSNLHQNLHPGKKKSQTPGSSEPVQEAGKGLMAAFVYNLRNRRQEESDPNNPDESSLFSMLGGGMKSGFDTIGGAIGGFFKGASERIGNLFNGNGFHSETYVQVQKQIAQFEKDGTPYKVTTGANGQPEVSAWMSPEAGDDSPEENYKDLLKSGKLDNMTEQERMGVLSYFNDLSLSEKNQIENQVYIEERTGYRLSGAEAEKIVNTITKLYVGLSNYLKGSGINISGLNDENLKQLVAILTDSKNQNNDKVVNIMKWTDQMTLSGKKETGSAKTNELMKVAVMRGLYDNDYQSIKNASYLLSRDNIILDYLDSRASNLSGSVLTSINEVHSDFIDFLKVDMTQSVNESKYNDYNNLKKDYTGLGLDASIAEYIIQSKVNEKVEEWTNPEKWNQGRGSEQQIAIKNALDDIRSKYNTDAETKRKVDRLPAAIKRKILNGDTEADSIAAAAQICNVYTRWAAGKIKDMEDRSFQQFYQEELLKGYIGSSSGNLFYGGGARIWENNYELTRVQGHSLPNDAQNARFAITYQDTSLAATRSSGNHNMIAVRDYNSNTWKNMDHIPAYNYRNPDSYNGPTTWGPDRRIGRDYIKRRMYYIYYSL